MRRTLALTGLSAVLFAMAAPAQHEIVPGRTDQIHLRYASFDPAQPVDVPGLLQGAMDTRLWIVQMRGLPTQAQRDSLRRIGAEIGSYLPESAYVVRMTQAMAAAAMEIDGVRTVSYYHPAFRLEPFLLNELATRGADSMAARKYNIVVFNKHTDKPGLMARIGQLGGMTTHEQEGSILLEVSLTGNQLVQAVRFDEVLWIDRWTEPELDMDNARIQGGGNYVETAGGFTGKGVIGHIYEGLEAGHQDFTNTPINVLSAGGADTHGHCTAGIVFGNGTSNPAARGMAPDIQAYYTQYGSVTAGFSRWQVVERLTKTHQVMFTTASWGGGRTRAYTSTSASSDDIVFDHDIIWTNSQSNAGNQDSRPEAWAKNVISIGGFAHRDNSNPADDSWQAGNGSTGPAADGRIKPDLSAYYDSILCSDRTGTAGYSSGNFTTGFGGTSGATPIVAGHNAIAIQMFTDGLFGPQRVPNGTRWQNKPRFTTLKALQIANASQYSFTASSTDNRREHVGWGMPNLKTMYDNRNVHFVVDETDVLKQGDGMAYTIQVAANQPELKISMCFADPAGNPSAALTRINDLTLRVTDPNGKKYWGNHGLTQGNYSLMGGDRDVRDTVENVFVQSPIAGQWKVEVLAYLVAQDSHVETTATDADFGLVVNGGTFVSKTPVQLQLGSTSTFGTSCTGSRPQNAACVSDNVNGSLIGSRGYDGVTYVLELSAPKALQATAFEIKLASRRTGSVNVAAYLYDATTAGQPNNILATGTINVGQSEGFYRATLNKTVSLAAGQKFFIGFRNDATTITLGITGSGNITPYWRNNGTGGAWVRFTTRPWVYRVICTATGGEKPILTSSTAPEVGAQYSIGLRLALQNSAAALFTGFSDQSWGGLPLPLDLAPLGATGCSLYTGAEVLQGFATGATGDVNAALDIPNNPVFVGATFYHQWLVIDGPANAAGLVLTNAARLKVGG